MPLEEKYLRLLSDAVPDLGADALSRLSRLYDLIVSTNEKINITSLVSPIDVTLKHFLDSLSLLLYPEFRQRAESGEWVCDVGCGGGFPGLPLACAIPEMPLTMIDSTEKKILALKENAAALGLSSVFPVWGRGEELSAAKGGTRREHFGLCVSRAVARLPVLCELCLPFVRVGGLFIAMKGAKTEEELEESKRAIPMLGGAVKEVFEIPFSQKETLLSEFTDEESEKIKEFSLSSRFLVVIEKKKATSSIYPRKWSQMVKKSL